MKTLVCRLVVTPFQAFAIIEGECARDAHSVTKGDIEAIALTNKVEPGTKAWRNMARSRCNRALKNLQNRHPKMLVSQKGSIQWPSIY